ncbi:hypothetical protein [Sulfuracidifex metallicus]|uniref:Uncharacterized protein n=2 Tax=Sulfuracidifex metallicus TaxID=47303 RepID=A0A6A9QNK6_SULME|nr:hypothetical protein [Sulfuracidifex metallicus]MUN29900.1 hypothetical protein [Sulfuracidifex metallicus DSM 6482 = JCM 9184]WOE51716.1 hypothetical protein RQ359_001042 [Sulfuracidifex metallicus DSM 6482 = JCM 9184]
MIVVVAPSAYVYLNDLVKVKDVTFYLTTMGISYALKNNIDVDSSLDAGFKVRAYSHKPPKITGIQDHELEAALVAKELEGYLLTLDENVIKRADEIGVKLITFESLSRSSSI